MDLLGSGFLGRLLQPECIITHSSTNQTPKFRFYHIPKFHSDHREIIHVQTQNGTGEFDVRGHCHCEG